MTELEYVLGNFERHFHRYTGKKIILHGTRSYAEGIIRQFGTRYDFLAVMTSEKFEGDTFCGLPVIEPSDIIPGFADLMILTERVKYEWAAYDAVKGICSSAGIELLDMYGLDFGEVYNEYRFRMNRLTEDLRCVDPYDVLIFEAVDCFLNQFDDVLKPNPRAERIFRYAKEKGKTVYFSLRKSCPEDKQIRALIKYGMVRDENDPALVRRTGEDLSLRSIVEKSPGKRLIYFSYGFENEFLLPRYYGIYSYSLVPFFDFKAGFLEKICLANEIEPETVTDLRSLIAAVIDRCDVISFDIFDTLVMRKTLYPEDVFDILGQRLNASGIIRNADEFAAERKRIQRETPELDIYAFYRILQNYLDLSESQREMCMAAELAAEKELIIRRDQAVSLFDLAKARGKTVVLTSDMYLHSEMIEKILTDLGISGWDELFVSCECHTFKNQELFRILQEKYPGKKILHLGNDIHADILPAGRYLIDTILIPSGLDLAEKSGWGEILQDAKRLDERNLLGLIISHVFNDPFIPEKYTNLDRLQKMERFAAMACLPVILGYLFWLAGNLKNGQFDRMLFLSRDGYILRGIYDEIRQKSAYPLPPETYMYASRHSSFLLCADNEEIIPLVRIIFERVPYATAFRNILGFEPLRHGETLMDYFHANMPEIREAVKLQKENFVKYLERSGISTDGKYAVMDFVSCGRTLDFLRTGAGLDLSGFFVARPDYDNLGRTDIRYFLDGYDEEERFFLDYYMEMEYIMTSPESSLDRFNEEGKPVFSDEVRTAGEIRDITYIQELIVKMSKEYIGHFYHDGISIGPGFAARSFAADGLHGIMKRAYDDWGKYVLI